MMLAAVYARCWIKLREARGERREARGERLEARGQGSEVKGQIVLTFKSGFSFASFAYFAGQNVLVNPGLSFPIFFFSKFHFFLPPSRHFAPFAVKNALVDPDLRSPIFYFPKILSFPPTSSRPEVTRPRAFGSF